jgi:lactoylglutathione lyase
MANMSMAAVGIGVSDLKKSTEFYTKVLGLKLQQELVLADLDENILGFEGTRSAAVVLMYWKDGVKRDYKDLPIKIVLTVPDVYALAKKVKDAGFQITREPALYEGFGTIGFAADPDGYQIEMMQAAPAPAKA